jgi:tape measure domain-containing protein
MLNLGTMLFGMGVDTRGLDNAISAVEAFGRTVQGAQTAANRGFATSIDMLRRQENTLLGGLERVASAQARLGNMRVDTSFVDRLNAAYATLVQRSTSAAAGLDPTKLDRARASFDQAVNSILREAGALNTATAAADKYANSIARAQEQALNLGARINTAPALGLGGAFSAQRNQMSDQLEQAFQTFRTQMSQPGITGQQAQQFQRQWTAAIGAVRREFNAMGTSLPGVFRALGDASLLATGRLGGLSLRFFSLGLLIKNYGATLGLAAGGTVAFASTVVSLGSASLNAAIKMQQIQYALTAMTKSTTQTAAELEFLQRVANTAGLRFDDLAASYNNFYVAAKTANLSLKDTHDVFQTVSQAAGVLHLQAQQTQLAFLALEQMLSKGTVQTEELRRQLGDQLPGAFQIAAKAMDVTTAKLSDMLKKHEIAANVFLPKFAAALRQAYGLDLSKEVDTLQANINRVHNSLFNFFNALPLYPVSSRPSLG